MIGSLAPWFGSKRTLAPRIVEALGPHRAYWEPFCGSMAVLLAKEPTSFETVNDLHADLINLATVIQDPVKGPRFYRRLRRTLASEGMFDRCAEQFNDAWTGEGNEERAFVYFTCSWLGRNGIAGTNIGQKRGAGHSFCVRYTLNGGQPNRRWFSAIASIPQWRERLRSVLILQRDAFEVIGNIQDHKDVAIYVDPPYLASTRSGFTAPGGSSHYRHDFASDDHMRLSTALNRFEAARVVVSYYDSPELDRLYPGWAKIDCTMRKSITNTGKDQGSKSAPEVLLINNRNAGGLFA